MTRKIARYLSLAALPAFALSAAAQDAPTFYQDALPVFQKNCVACHQPDGPSVGGIYAPMSLMDYEAAKLWAPLIRNALETGYMPPWGAHERHRGEFKGERYIDKAEKDLLIRLGLTAARWRAIPKRPPTLKAWSLRVSAPPCPSRAGGSAIRIWS